MSEIITDNQSVKDILNAIIAIVEKTGGTIHPAINIHCVDDNLSIFTTDKTLNNTPIISIPHAALLPRKDFELSLKDKKITIEQTNDSLSDDQKELMRLTLNLYEITNKYEYHTNSCPWFCLDDRPDLLKLLLQARQGPDITAIRKNLNDKKNHEQFFINMFLKSRILNCRLQSNEFLQTNVLMPILDFFNHHVSGSPYQNDYKDTDEPKLMIHQATPETDTLECFANYARHDALDSYLNYGFVDQTAPFIRSIPLTINLGSIGDLYIRSAVTQVKKITLPEIIRDIAFYMPKTNLHREKKIIELSHILVPQNLAPQSMRRILDYAIGMLSGEIGEIERHGLILKAENEIVSKNIGYYQSLLNQVKNTSNDNLAAQTLMDLAQAQIQKLHHYEDIII